MANTLRILTGLIAFAVGMHAWAKDCDEPATPVESVATVIGDAASAAHIATPTETILAAGEQIDVDWLQQRERKQCLLYTMGMVIATHDPNAPSPKALYEFALAHTYTTPQLGGLMRVMDIATIARRKLPAEKYEVTHVAGNTSMDYLEASLKAGNPPLVVYFSDAYGNPALPLVDQAERHAGGTNPQASASGETREDPFARKPVRAGDGPVPPTPVPEHPNRAGATAHAAVLTGIYTHTDGVTYVTAVEPFYGKRVWRADQFEASFAKLGRQAVIVSKKPVQ